MDVSFEKPPIWEEANKKFDLENLGRPVVFTYGNTIHNPWILEIPDDTICHEELHKIQQEAFEGGPEAWWRKYLDDVEFRISQEIAAYARQYKFICKTVKDRNRQARVLWDLANMMSGPIYGKVLSHSEAMNRIRKESVSSKI